MRHSRPRRSSRPFVSLAATLLASLAESAPALAADVTGRVFTPDGRPVSRAVIVVEGEGARHDAVTDINGAFRVDLKDGAYRVSARGFTLDRDALNVAGAPVILDITLRPADLREDVIVSATRSETAVSSVGVSATVFDRDALRSRQTLRLTDVLAEAPGASVATTGGVGAQASLFVRGGESRFARVLIDGVPVNEPGGFFNFGTLLTPDVERVEVVRGSFGTLYGSDALAGVVSLESATGRNTGTSPLRARGDAGVGDLATRSFSGTLSGHRGDTSGAASAARTATDNAQPNADFSSRLFAASIEHRLSPQGGAVSASFRTNRSEGGTPGATVFGRPDLDARYERTLTIASLGARFVGGALSHALRAGFKRDDQRSIDRIDSGSFRPAFGGRRGAFDSSDFPGSDYLNRTDRVFATYEARAQAGRHALTFGGDLERETGELGSADASPLKPRRTSAGAFVQDQVAFSSRAFATVSARSEHNGSTGTTLVPHASIALVAASRASTQLIVRGSAGAGIKAPSFFESYGTSSFALGNPDLKAERARTFEGGLDLRVAGRLRFEATAFRHEYRDQISYKVVSFSPFKGTYENLGETQGQGVELSSEWRIHPRLRLFGNYTWQKTRIVTSVSTDPALAIGRELRRRPRHQGSATAEGTLGKATLAATLAGASLRYDSDFLGIGLTENPGFHRLDLRGAVRVHPRALLLAALENATNARYQEVLGYQALPRRFRITLSFDSLK